MRFLLCGINAKYIHSNLAIFCLRSYAAQHCNTEAEIEIREFTINHYVEDILREIYEARADVIVFSCYIWNIRYVRELAEELARVCPETDIWVGGPEVSYHAEEFLEENPAVQLVMQGEGEEQFAALVNLWQSGERVTEEKLPAGVAWREPEKIANRGFAPAVAMDEVPFVYEEFQLFEHKILYYETSRGCPFRCSYCLSSIDKTVRFRSMDIVKKELNCFLEAKVPQVKFVDRTFNCNKSRAMEIWKYIAEKDNGVTNFHFEISADLLGEEEMELFATMRPGLIQLEIGVQSTHPETVLAIHRHMDLEKLFANVDRVHEMGNIHQHLDLIAGLPMEGLTEFEKSFDDLYIHEPDQLQLGFLKVLHGTRMESEAEEYGIIYRGQPPYEVLSTKWLIYDDVLRLKGVEELVEMYYNSMQFTWTLRYVVPQFKNPFAFYDQFAVWYRRNGYHKTNHNRVEKYEILRAFLQEKKERRDDLDIPYLDETMILDLYLREKAKTRPSWAADLKPYKEQWKTLYREQGNVLFPVQSANGTYDSRKAANASHMERFSFDVAHLMKEKEWIAGESTCLFDYGERNPLNHNARLVAFTEKAGKVFLEK